MPVPLIVRLSLLPLPFALGACNSRSPEPATQSPSSLEQTHWSNAAAQQLRDAVARRAAHGLDKVTFDVMSGPATPQNDAALTRAALRYAAALAHGVTDPEKLFSTYTLRQNTPDLKRGLAQALSQGKVGGWLESLAPQDQNYQNLSKAYLVLRNKRQPPAPDIPNQYSLENPIRGCPRLPNS